MIPAASASFDASHAAVNEMKCNMLRASFIRVPAPGSPAWTISDAHCVNGSWIKRERLVGRADHHGQLALLRCAAAAGDRCVDDVNALRLKLFGELDGGAGTDRRMNGDHGAGLRICGQLTDDIAHLLVVEHRHADDVGGRDIGHAVGQRRALLGQRRHRLGAHVENRYPAGPLDQRLAIGAPILPRPMYPSFTCLLMIG